MSGGELGKVQRWMIARAAVRVAAQSAIHAAS